MTAKRKQVKREKTDHAFAVSCAIAARGEEPTRSKVAIEAEVSEATAQRALEKWQFARDINAMPPRPELAPEPLPAELDTEALPDSGKVSVAKAKAVLQRRYEAMTRRYEKEFKDRVYVAARQKILDGEGAFIEMYGAKLRKADDVRNAYKGIASPDIYQLVLRCLHPDNSASPEKRAEAFAWWREHKHLLVKAETAVRTGFPKTFAEALAQRNAARAAKRGAK